MVVEQKRDFDLSIVLSALLSSYCDLPHPTLDSTTEDEDKLSCTANTSSTSGSRSRDEASHAQLDGSSSVEMSSEMSSSYEDVMSASAAPAQLFQANDLNQVTFGEHEIPPVSKRLLVANCELKTAEYLNAFSELTR